MAIGVFNGNFRAGDYRRYRQQIEADAKNPRKALERIEENLMLECIALEGDKFVEYWDSDAVPAFGFIRDRIDLLRARIANLQLQPNPIDEAQAIELEIDAKLDSELIRNHLPETNASGNLQWQGVEFDMPAIVERTQARSAELKAQIDARTAAVKSLNSQAVKNVRLGTQR